MVTTSPIQLHGLVTMGAAVRPEAPAVSYGDQTYSYGRLADEIHRAGSGLQRLGLSRNDRVAVYLEKRLETVVACFGTSAAGGAFVPVNPLLKPPQVAHILQDSAARVLVTSAERLGLLGDSLADCSQLEQVVVVGDGAGDGVSWEELIGGAADVDTGGRVESDMVAILYTSGSTGAPKGVVLSHRNMVVGAESVSAYLGNGPHDVILALLPLSFDAGFSQLTTAFAAGAHVILVNYLLPRDVVKLCERHSVTGLTCVPPLWMQLADLEWPVEATRTMRYFANTGGRMPKTTLERLRELFPQASPFLMYGLTEAFRSTYLDPSQVDVRPDSIGKAIPNAEILVVRPDGSPCDANEHGELVHRGPLVSLGYWGDPERTAERFRPDPTGPPGLPGESLAVWSGDIVRRDHEGFLYFVGRNDEMIKTSGYRVSPTEIEEAAYATGMVGGAAAFGVEDDRLGQAIVLVVTPGPSGDVDGRELIAALRRQLPLYMVPREVLVRDELPRSPNGKLDRVRLRQELAG